MKEKVQKDFDNVIKNLSLSQRDIEIKQFYLDNFIPGYKNGCTRDEIEFSRQCFVSERHKQQHQWQLLKVPELLHLLS